MWIFRAVTCSAELKPFTRLQLAFAHSGFRPSELVGSHFKKEINVLPSQRTWSPSAQEVDRMLADFDAQEKKALKSRTRRTGINTAKTSHKLSPQECQSAATVQPLSEREERKWNDRTNQMIKDRFAHSLQRAEVRKMENPIEVDADVRGRL